MTSAPALQLTPEQLHTLRHMLGINTPYDERPIPSRDYAAVQPGDPEFLALQAAGAVELYRKADAATAYDWYRCSDAGRAAAMASHRTIRASRSQRTYWRFLHVRDALGDISFREFLTDPAYAQSRRGH